MDQTAVYIAVAILASWVPLVVALITKIDSRFNECIKQRKSVLYSQFITEIGRSENKTKNIDPYLHFFKEYEDIQDWKNKRKSLFDMAAYSIGFVIFGFIVGLLNINIGAQIPLENILVVLGAFFLLYLIYSILTLYKQTQDWQQKQ